jgi:hypothetical protein
MKLPFKSPSNLFSNINLFNASNPFENLINNRVLFIGKSYTTRAVVFIDSSAIFAIWQPPKSV